jgi:hypothetical protein
MNRRQHERLAHLACVMWWPFDRPEVPDDEVPSERDAALRKWRGQDEGDEDRGEPNVR